MDERIETWAEIAKFFRCSESKLHSKLRRELTGGGFVFYQRMHRTNKNGDRRKKPQIVAVAFKSALMQYLSLKAEKKEVI